MVWDRVRGKLHSLQMAVSREITKAVGTVLVEEADCPLGAGEEAKGEVILKVNGH